MGRGFKSPLRAAISDLPTKHLIVSGLSELLRSICGSHDAFELTMASQVTSRP